MKVLLQECTTRFNCLYTEDEEYDEEYCIVLFLGGSVVRGEDSNLAQFLESQRAFMNE